jgi:hypothetical protein
MKAKLLEILQEIDDFDLKCEAEEYTDTCEAWDLLHWIQGTLQQELKDKEEHRGTAGKYLDYCFRGDTVSFYSGGDTITQMGRGKEDILSFIHEDEVYYIHWEKKEIRRWNEAPYI